MAKESPRQRRITGRVMHEFKHGELKSGRGGKAGKVKNRGQAIAIALEEAGASKYESGRRNRRNLRRTEGKEAKGRTAQQEREGKSHVVPRASAKAPAPWADAMRGRRPHTAGTRQLHGRARPTVIPSRNSTRVPGSAASRAVRR